ncbi:MAG: OmpA family protein, partial [Solimonas sp.]
DNLALSQRRADAVKAWLVKDGIAAGRVQTLGRGENFPVGDNATEEGRRLNRRVEILIPD